MGRGHHSMQKGSKLLLSCSFSSPGALAERVQASTISEEERFLGGDCCGFFSPSVGPASHGTRHGCCADRSGYSFGHRTALMREVAVKHNALYRNLQWPLQFTEYIFQTSATAAAKHLPCGRVRQRRGLREDR